MFYLKLLTTLQAAKDAPAVAPPAQWLRWLDGRQRAGEIDRAQRDAAGLDGWLRTQGPVSRDALAAYAQERAMALDEAALADQAMFQAAYHGTPHRFDAFSLAAVGTGEGAQAFGWGMYFAGKREVAEYYQTALSETIALDGIPMLAGNKQLEASTGNKAADELILAYRGDIDAALLDQNNWLGEYRQEEQPNALEDEHEILAVLEGVRDRGGLSKSGEGFLHQVDIPEDSDLLDWHTPISEQGDNIQAAFMDASGSLGRFANDTGGDAYRRLAFDFGGLRSIAAGEQASKILNAAGIPGVRYLDTANRHGAADGGASPNYVIWDESVITMEVSASPETDVIVEGDLHFMVSSTDAAVDERAVLPDLSAQIQTDAFKDWFGKSVVANEDGTPKPVFHGTQARFSEFTIPAWFSPSYHNADMFSSYWGEDGVRTETSSVVPVFLSLQNPYRTDDWSVTEGHALDPVWRNNLINTGHDGVLFEKDGEIEYIAFYPEQITSAISPGVLSLEETPGKIPVASGATEARFSVSPAGDAGGLGNNTERTISIDDLERHGAATIKDRLGQSISLREEMTPETVIVMLPQEAPAFIVSHAGTETAYDISKPHLATKAILDTLGRTDREALFSVATTLSKARDDGARLEHNVFGSSDLSVRQGSHQLVMPVERHTGRTVMGIGAYAQSGEMLGRFNDLSAAAAHFQSTVQHRAMTREQLLADISSGPLASLVLPLIESGEITLHGGATTMPSRRRFSVAETNAKGQVALNAGAMNADMVTSTIMHEAFHRAKSRMRDTGWQALMRSLEDTYTKQVSASPSDDAFWADARRHIARAKSLGHAMQWRAEVEEFGAYAVQAYASAPATVKSWVNTFTGYVKAWGLKAFGKQFGRVTPAQLAAVAKMALRDNAIYPEAYVSGAAPQFRHKAAYCSEPSHVEAYHGSALDTDRLAIDKASVSPSADRQGHGIHLCTNKQLAERHRDQAADMMSARGFLFDGEPYYSFASAAKKLTRDEIKLLDKHHADEQIEFAGVNNFIASFSAAVTEQEAPEVAAIAQTIVDRIAPAPELSGVLYEASLPAPRKMLISSITLLEQSPSVERALGSAIKRVLSLPAHANKTAEDISCSMTGDDIYTQLALTFPVDEQPGNAPTDYQSASAFMANAGICGMCATEKRSAYAHSNEEISFVMWDDTAITLRSKNGMTVEHQTPNDEHEHALMERS